VRSLGVLSLLDDRHEWRADDEGFRRFFLVVVLHRIVHGRGHALRIVEP
jgi:hypothetical protein